MLNPLASKEIFYVDENGRLVRYKLTYTEYVEMYIKEIKEKYGENTEVIVKEKRYC